MLLATGTVYLVLVSCCTDNSSASQVKYRYLVFRCQLPGAFVVAVAGRRY
jgi:hypothetical protein